MKRFMLLILLVAGYAQQALACQITPIELLKRPFLTGPMMSLTASKSNQFAGRTTLNSGSATVPVSTSAVNSDSLIFPTLQAALVAGYSVQGRTAIASGTSFGTASTVAVYSGDNIALTWESPNAITSGQALRVDSIVDGISFAIATSNSLTTVASGAVAMWRINGKSIEGIKVNTISPQGHFTLGWADGVARPVDTTIMWEIRRAS